MIKEISDLFCLWMGCVMGVDVDNQEFYSDHERMTMEKKSL